MENDRDTKPSDSPGPPRTTQAPHSPVQHDSSHHADSLNPPTTTQAPLPPVHYDSHHRGGRTNPPPTFEPAPIQDNPYHHTDMTNLPRTLEPSIQDNPYHPTDWTNLPWILQSRLQDDTGHQADWRNPPPTIQPPIPSFQEVPRTQSVQGVNHNPLTATSSSTLRPLLPKQTASAPERIAPRTSPDPIPETFQTFEPGSIAPDRCFAQASSPILPVTGALREPKDTKSSRTTNPETAPRPLGVGRQQQKPSLSEAEQRFLGIPNTSTRTREEIRKGIRQTELSLRRANDTILRVEDETELSRLETSIQSEEYALKQLKEELSRATE